MVNEVAEDRSNDWSMVESEDLPEVKVPDLISAEPPTLNHNSLKSRIQRGLGSLKSLSSNSLSSHFSGSNSHSTLNRLSEVPTPICDSAVDAEDVPSIYPPVPSKLDFEPEDTEHCDSDTELDSDGEDERPTVRLITPRTRRSSVGSLNLSTSPRKPIKLDLSDLPPVPTLPESFRNGAPFIFGSPAQEPVTDSDFTKATEKVLAEMSKRMGGKDGSMNGTGLVGRIFSGLSRSASTVSGRSQSSSELINVHEEAKVETLNKKRELENDRFENVHEREFSKMPSIANDPSLNRFGQNELKRQVSESSQTSLKPPSFKRLRVATPTLSHSTLTDNRIDNGLRNEGWYEDSPTNTAVQQGEDEEEARKAERIAKLRADRRTTLENKRHISNNASARRKSVGRKLPKKTVTTRLLNSFRQVSAAVTMNPAPRDTLLLGKPLPQLNPVPRIPNQRNFSNASATSNVTSDTYVNVNNTREFTVKGRKPFDLQASLARGTKFKPSQYRHPCDNTVPLPLPNLTKLNKPLPPNIRRSVSSTEVLSTLPLRVTRSVSSSEIGTSGINSPLPMVPQPIRSVLTNLVPNSIESEILQTESDTLQTESVLPFTSDSIPLQQVTRRPRIDLEKVKAKVNSERQLNKLNRNSGLRRSPRKLSPIKGKGSPIKNFNDQKVKSFLQSQRGRGGLMAKGKSVKVVNGMVVLGNDSPIKVGNDTPTP